MAKPIAVRGERRWGSNYPPLVMAGLILLALLTVLPSALDLPQSNPSETLEYAPVPPEDEKLEDPPPGNLSSLGLGTSGSFGAGAGGEGDGGGGGGEPDLAGRGKNPSTKRCVGKPPRQTEDPASPPCVAFFSGNNFGATYQGVTADEIRVLLFSDRLGDPNEQSNYYYDLAKEPETTEPLLVTEFRRYQRYFNERYQTYGRFVHFYAYYATQVPNPSPEQRRADAIANYTELKPFAVVTSSSIGGNEDEYTALMAKRGVLNFGSAGMRAAAFYNRHARMLWGYQPSVENHAASFTSYACEQVVGKPTINSGNLDQNGKPRRLGLLRTSDEGRPDLIALGLIIREQMKACGAVFEAERTFPVTGRVFQTEQEDRAASYATANMADFAQKGITTIIQAGGFETDQSKAAGAINYRPEWILAGDGQLEGQMAGRYQNQDVWSHAWLVSAAPRVGAGHNPCLDVQKEVEPDADTSVTAACTFSWYEGVRQLMTAVQVAGPRLNPASIDKGFRAIPSKSSSSPWLAACFYPGGDYTCVKDAWRAWWDPGGANAPDQTPGCWRMIEEGRRYLTATWPAGNIDALRTTADPCNELATNFYGF